MAKIKKVTIKVNKTSKFRIEPERKFQTPEAVNQLHEGRRWGKSIANKKKYNILKTGHKELERADDPISARWRA